MDSLALDIGQELVVDLFAGGGGASLGLARAYREPDVAVNHDPVAIAVHRANHPTTEHFTCDVFEVDPRAATRNRPVGVLWASPDCRHHSKAAGGKPRSKRVRGLAWVVVRWAAVCRPRIIHLENVEEFADWGPLIDGQPCKVRKGITFRRWVRELERMGYKVEHRELIAADLGAPTIRKRLYVVARCDGLPIVWPAQTHSKAGGVLPKWRSAADCIDFSDMGRSIFDRPRPLKPNTCRRLARGAWRYVLDCPTPFIVPLRGTSAAHHSTHSIDGPLSVVSAGGTHHALTIPHLTEFANASSQRSFAVDEALRTQCAQVKGGHFAMAAAHLTHLTHHGGDRSTPLDESFRTVTAANRGEQALVVQVPVDSIDPDLLARAKRCAAFLHEYLPEHFPEPADLVLVGDYVLVDFTLRMLYPRELARAQGFPADYILERGLFELPDGTLEWRPITKTDQVRLIGNSVCPDVAEAIARANTVQLRAVYAGALA